MAAVWGGLAISCPAQPLEHDYPGPSVATWAGFGIPQADFVQAYRRYATVVPGRDTPARRADFARALLERGLIAERAQNSGLDTLAWVQHAVRRARDRAMRGVFFQTTIGVSIPEPQPAQVREAFRRLHSRVLLRQVFTRSEAEAARWQAALATGASFDSLAALGAAQYGAGSADPGGLLGWVSGGEISVSAENVAFSLDIGAVGGPVASENGWHFFRVEDRVETAFADASTFENMRERLAFEWRQRRFEEAASHYLRTHLEAIPLRIDAGALSRVWPMVAEYAPRRGSPREVLRLEQELPVLAPYTLPRSTTLAWVDGAPFTLADFLAGLPDVEVVDWNPDLVGALETTIRDRIVTGWAREAGADTARSVQLAEAVARRAAYYDAAVAAAADTLTLARYAAQGYKRVRDAYFTEKRSATVRLWTFADRAAARGAVDAWVAGTSWARAAAGADTHTVKVDLDAPDALPLGALQPSRQGDRTAFTGPLRINGDWTMVELLERHTTYTPFEKVTSRLEPLLEAMRLDIAHEALLPPGYRREDVTIFPDRLEAALPFY